MTLLPRLGKAVPGASIIGRPLASSELEKVAKYLFRGTFSASQIGGGIVVVGIAIFVSAVIILTQWFNIISTIALSSSLSLIIILVLTNVYTNKYRMYVARIEQVTPYVLEELTTIYLSTKSIFDAVYYVSRGPYDPISSTLHKFVRQINEGLPPERLLTKLAINQPSITLKRGLLAFINFIETRGKGIETVIQNAHENVQRNFERLTMQWESRMMIYTGILVFLPIIIALGITMRGLGTNPFILILPLAQYLLSGILQKLLLPEDIILLGE